MAKFVAFPMRITACGEFIMLDIMPGSSNGCTVALDVATLGAEPPEVEPWRDADEDEEEEGCWG